MSKGKSNKNNEDANFHNDPEVEKVIELDLKTEEKPFDPEVFPPIAATVKVINPGEEIKVHAENIVEAGSDTTLAGTPAKEELKVNIVNVGSSAPKAEAPKAEPKKINIVDVSKKKTGSQSKVSDVKSKVLSILPHPLKDKVDLINVSFDDKDLDKALDSLIYLGGGVIAVTSLTSKALANIGNYLIKK